MKRNAAAAAILGGILLASLPVQADSFCPLHETFDPRGATGLVPSGQVPTGWAYFRSPEMSDPWVVWYCGDAATANGSIGGARPGSDRPTGVLEIELDEVTCFELDVIAAAPYQADIYDPGGTLLLSFTTSSVTYALPTQDRIFEGYRVVLTPGLVNGERDELRVDNMRAAYAPVSTRPGTWGGVKLIYRADGEP
jgi:hypothetical protein